MIKVAKLKFMSILCICYIRLVAQILIDLARNVPIELNLKILSLYDLVSLPISLWYMKDLIAQ